MADQRDVGRRNETTWGPGCGRKVGVVSDLASLRFLYYYPCYHHCAGYLQLRGGTDKSLARPGRKQATATEDFEFHISYL